MQEAPETNSAANAAIVAIAGNPYLVGTVLAIVTLIALVTLAALWRFGSRIYSHLLTDVLASLNGAAAQAKEINGVSLLSWIREFLGKRNEFYTLFGQFALALGVTVMLVALIALRVVSSEAGLPLIAAIAAYVLGKGVASSGSSAPATGTPGQTPNPNLTMNNGGGSNTGNSTTPTPTPPVDPEPTEPQRQTRSTSGSFSFTRNDGDQGAPA